MFTKDKEKVFYLFLIFLVFFGVFFRFWALDSTLFWRDEPIHFIAALKMNHQDLSINAQDPRLWFLEHPQVATTTMGLLTRLISSDYSDVIRLTKHYGYLYLPYEVFKDTFVSIRLMSAIFGTIVIFLIFFITKQLWGVKAGIWSSVLASLSLDFIGISRIAFLEIFLIAYFLLALLFYFKFLDAKDGKKKFLFLALTIAFTVMTLGTRWGPPFLLFPVFGISILFFPAQRLQKKWVALLFLGLILSLPIFYYYILGPQVAETITGQISSSLDNNSKVSEIPADTGYLSKAFSSFEKFFGKIFQNNLLFVLGAFIFKHSYIFLFSFLVFLWFWASKIFSFNYFLSFLKLKGLVQSFKGSFSLLKLKLFLANPDKKLVIFLFFIFSFLFFSFTIFGSSLRYFTILFVPAIILMGKPLAELSKKNLGKVVLGILLFLNLVSIVSFFPYFTTYGNFGSKDFQVLGYFDAYNLLPEQMAVLDFLEDQGNPVIFTNLPNLLVFYKGKALPIPPSDEKFRAYSICKSDLEKSVKGSYIVLLGQGFENSLYNGRYWYCPEFMALEVSEIKEYGLVYEDGTRFPFGTISIFKPAS